MGKRLDLHDELKNILGSNNVYFQPPSTRRMDYPCIRYELNDDVPEYADNRIYNHTKSYTVTIIDYDPDSLIPDKLFESMKYCSFDRFYASDNLNHFVYKIFY